MKGVKNSPHEIKSMGLGGCLLFFSIVYSVRFGLAVPVTCIDPECWWTGTEGLFVHENEHVRATQQGLVGCTWMAGSDVYNWRPF